jgi:hypothetical protein
MEIIKNLILFSITVLIICILQKKKNFSIFTRNLLILSAISTLFIIGTLFQESYMWDMVAYKNNVNSIRNFIYEIRPDGKGVIFFSGIYSIFPLPFLDTTLRLGFVTKIFYILFFVYLISKNYIKEKSFYFYLILCWPSAIIYSSVPLREILVTILYFFILKTLINKQYFFLIICSLILLILKTYNFLIFLPMIISYIILFQSKLKFLDILAILSFLLFFIGYPYFDNIILFLNESRMHLYVESGIKYQNVEKIPTDLIDFTIFAFKSGIYFLFSPTLEQLTNSFRLIQFLENVTIFSIISYFSIQAYKIDPKKTLFWALGFFSCLAIYGLVSHNPGSIARWRFPILVNYLLIIKIDILKNKLFKKIL